jgi:hypothetical protein
MAQGVLPYKYEEERSDAGMTALAGLPIYLDLAWVLGLGDSFRAHVHIRESGQGWTDEQAILSLILLNLAGGDCGDDIQVLEKDEGFCKVLGRVETKGLTRQQRRAMGGGERSVTVLFLLPLLYSGIWGSSMIVGKRGSGNRAGLLFLRQTSISKG